MDAVKHSNDFKPIDSEGGEVESSHLQMDSISSYSQSKEVVESIHLQSDSSSLEAQSLGEVESDDLIKDPTPSEAQSVVGEISLNGDAQVVEAQSVAGEISFNGDAQVVEAQSVAGKISFNGDAQVVDNYASNSEQSSSDLQLAYIENAQVVDNRISISQQHSYDPVVAYVGASSSDSNKPFTYNGVTYYSYEAYLQDVHRQFIREMQMDGAAPRSLDVDEPPFSDSMVLATGGSPAVINPYNGLPWRKGANLCRPYMEERCCYFGTACIFHHPWPPTKEPP